MKENFLCGLVFSFQDEKVGKKLFIAADGNFQHFLTEIFQNRLVYLDKNEEQIVYRNSFHYRNF